MTPPEAGDKTGRIEITASMDRRRAEALAVAVRQRLRELGYDGARITVAPSRGGAKGTAGADTAASSV